MAQEPVLIDVGPANLDDMPCCGIKSKVHPGRAQKQCWLKKNFSHGVRAKTLLDADGRPCGYIEYLPGEFAWRGVNAAGYMFIHCIWNHSKEGRHRGWAGAMLDGCVQDAKDAGMNGVAVVTRESPWLADSRVFQANGFVRVDTAPPDYQLLVRKLDPHAADPSFKSGWVEKLARYKRGLTIIQSAQCPYIAKFTREISRTAEDEFGLTPKFVELKSFDEAQNAPTPYAVFAVIYKGKLVADHQISRTRFRNAMSALLG